MSPLTSSLTSSLKSSVLIIGHPNKENIFFGADFYQNYQEIKEIKFKEKKNQSLLNYPVIAINYHNISLKQFNNLHKQITFCNNLSQIILIVQKEKKEDIIDLFNLGNIFKILPTFEEKEFEKSVHEALEYYHLKIQKKNLLKLTNEQNEKLQNLSNELENKIKDRRSHLLKEKRKSIDIHNKVETLNKCLITIHQANSINEIEKSLYEILTINLPLDWIRIVFHGQNYLFHNIESKSHLFNFLRYPIYKSTRNIGYIYFACSPNYSFSKNESTFLSKISTAISIAIDRLNTLEQMEAVKKQWEVTFNAISRPLCISDENGLIVRSNKAFARQAAINNLKEILNKPFWEVLFKESVNFSIPIGVSFQLPVMSTKANNIVMYEIISHSININKNKQYNNDNNNKNNNKNLLYVNLFCDLLEQKKMEQQIFQTARLAELGTIGSSIAHELNNPLAALLSFIQLILLDMNNTHPWYNELIEMEKGAYRCCDIIQNLLNFSRKTTNHIKEEIDLKNVIKRAIKITEVQTRSRGISINLNFPDDQKYLIMGNLNILSQAICNILQNAVESIKKKKEEDKYFKGKIIITISNSPKEFILEIEDNGLGISNNIINRVLNPLFTTKDPLTNPGLGLTVSYQIVQDHKGNLEIISIRNQKTIIKISFPRLDFIL